MATKLKSLRVTSVDLVDQGANPESHVCLYKRGEAGEGTGAMPEQETPAQGRAHGVKKDAAPGRGAGTQGENAAGESAGNRKEAHGTMRIDKSRMTKEDLAALEGLEKKYGFHSPEGEGADPGDAAAQGSARAEDPGIAKGAAGSKDSAAIQGTDPASRAEGAGSAALHPEVKKALEDFQELTKRQAAEVEELKKSLEIERLTAYAKKFELLGKDPGELAEKLYGLKKAGGTVYDDYVALLDENLAVIGKSGIFEEIGSGRQGSAGTEQTIGIKAAELAKSANGGMDSAEAIVKAFEQNPELAAQYEREYMGR
ncbi:MAG: hypothetical protein IJF88_10100 [Oscillospiraceae bacterium]|nr:hypothetical protein [Oscillospiraceae bacterium]